LGSLPVIADFSRRLDIAGIIDRACPMRDVALTSHGQVTEALIANRLTSPKAMVAVADWARQWAVAEIYGIDADTLNDDRLGRALDALADQAGAEVVAATLGSGPGTAEGAGRCHPGTLRGSRRGGPAPARGVPRRRSGR